MVKKHSLRKASESLFDLRNEEGFVITEDIKGHQWHTYPYSSSILNGIYEEETFVFEKYVMS